MVEKSESDGLIDNKLILPINKLDSANATSSNPKHIVVNMNFDFIRFQI